MFQRFVNTFHNFDERMLEQIEHYYRLLVKWNKSHNLVQKHTLQPEIFEVRHLIDCWQLTQHLSKETPILDIGSGAGLPGIFLSIAGFNVDLIEQDSNKVAFLKNCKTNLKLNCNIISDNVYNLINPYDQLTSRAFSSLSNLLSIQANVSRETIGFFLKGINLKGEIEQAKSEFNFDIFLSPSVSDPESRLVIVKNVSRETKSISSY